ncbi:MAG: sensor histidine kinase [Rhodospirillaceae bacterium]|nr:sensor histidine kinase [Rhodospirillaceae bacterium]
MNELRPDSLKRRLLIRLSVPLLGLMLLGAGLSFAAARYFAAMVHDQWLYDSAMSLASQLGYSDGEVVVDLPDEAVQMFEWDHADRIYYEIASHAGHIFGNATVPLPPEIANGPRGPGPRYFLTQVDGVPVRAATIFAAGAGDQLTTVTVAETLAKRDAVVRHIMVAMLPLEVAFLFLASALIWFTVTTTLRSLDVLSTRLSRLDVDRLEPVSDVADVPAEVGPLVNALNHLIGRLASASEAQRRFVANAAHQLRTPLATMQVQTQRALREADPAKQALALADIQKAMVRLKHMTQQLLSLARAEHEPARTLEMHDLDVAVLVREALEPLMDAAIARMVDLGYDGPASGVWIKAEPQLLRELIANLVDNAIRYGQQGGMVTVHVTRSPVSIAVEDDGPGIPDAERVHVTERFYRMSSSPAGGSGLGLSIASEIAARHNAQLAITTPPSGKGTMVSVTFTGVDGAAAPPPAQTQALPRQAAAE